MPPPPSHGFGAVLNSRWYRRLDKPSWQPLATAPTWAIWARN
jgi:tryptophan-rich sensory protein